jgi:hypothetical protein
MSEIVFGDGPKARRFQLRLTHKGVRIAEAKIGNRALWTVAQQGGEMPIGVAMEFYQRITPKKEDDDADPTDPQSENPNP